MGKTQSPEKRDSYGEMRLTDDISNATMGWTRRSAQRKSVDGVGMPTFMYSLSMLRIPTRRREKNPKRTCAGSTTTCIDRSLVHNKVEFQQTQPITAKGMSGSQVLDKYVELSLYISGKYKVNGATASIKLQTMAYLVNGLAAGALIGMDTVAKEGARLDLGKGKLTVRTVHAVIVYKI